MPGESIQYLTVEELIAIQQSEIENFGGSVGVRDLGLLESAAAMPMAAAFGQAMHPTLAAKAAAYAFHICKNHPFVDGNKRVAAVAARVFLRINGAEFRPTNDELAETILAVASGRMDKADLIDWFEGLVVEDPDPRRGD